jgi:hypothetical protein
MDIDRLIEKMEADLAALKRARDLMRGGAGGVTVEKTGDGKQVNGSAWYDELPAMLSEGSMTAKEIENRLKERHPDLAYSTVFSWLKRAVARGEYAKRARKFRYVGSATE